MVVTVSAYTLNTILRLNNILHNTKEMLKYEPLITELYKSLKNNSGTKEEYKEIRRLLNYFKGIWINILTSKN